MPGYNIFATGPVGVGKRTALEAQLHKQARRPPGARGLGVRSQLPRSAAADRRFAAERAAGNGWSATCAGSSRTRAVSWPRRWRATTYSRRQRELTEPIEREQETALTELREHAQAGGIAFELTPTGVVTVPLRGGQPMTPAEFAQLPESVRDRYQAAIDELGPRIQAFLTGMRARQREARVRLRALEHEVALFAVGHLIDELKERYAAYGTSWSSGSPSVQEDVIENLALVPGGRRRRTEPRPLHRLRSDHGRRGARAGSLRSERVRRA